MSERVSEGGRDMGYGIFGITASAVCGCDFTHTRTHARALGIGF